MYNGDRISILNDISGARIYYKGKCVGRVENYDSSYITYKYKGSTEKRSMSITEFVGMVVR